jgi:hypothetical protein
MTHKPDLEPVATLVEFPDHFALDANHERIWLSAICEEERTWCQDQRGGCDECGKPEVEYIRADLVEARVASALLALEGERDDLQKLVDFTIRWAWRESPITDEERLSCIKWHPTLREMAVKAGYPNGALFSSEHI